MTTPTTEAVLKQFTDKQFTDWLIRRITHEYTTHSRALELIIDGHADRILVIESRNNVGDQTFYDWSALVKNGMPRPLNLTEDDARHIAEQHPYAQYKKGYLAGIDRLGGYLLGLMSNPSLINR